MSQYALSHKLAGERGRLALMSALLDPMERAQIQRLGARPGWRRLEPLLGRLAAPAPAIS